MQLYCLYCTDEGHCIVTETFDTNLNLVVIRLVRERNKSHIEKLIWEQEMERMFMRSWNDELLYTMMTTRVLVGKQ